MSNLGNVLGIVWLPVYVLHLLVFAFPGAFFWLTMAAVVLYTYDLYRPLRRSYW